MIYDVHHRTTIRYARAVRLARFNVRLKPALWPGQRLLHHRMTVEPQPAAMHTESGPWLVNRSRLTLRDPIEQLVIDSRFTVEVAEPSFLRDFMPPPGIGCVREQALACHDLSAAGPATYLYRSGMTERPSDTISQWARPFFADENGSIVAAGRALMHAIFSEFTYDSHATRTDTPPDEAFGQRRGVCQDFARIMIVAARAHGVPAAYVSGYLRTLPPPGQPRLVGADAMHAWVNLWCGEQLGWIGFDPTNDCLADSSHIFTAMGRDYADVAPIDGIYHGTARQEMDLAVDVIPRG